MYSWIMLILLTLLQGLCGLGLISLFRVWIKPGMMVALWMISGVAVFSMIPFLLQLFYVPLTAENIFPSLVLVCMLLNARYERSIDCLKKVIRTGSFRIRLYEIPFLIVIAAIVFISVWRCFYLPPTPRDLTSGAEVIAEYATREKTMINSVFTVNLESTNNQFKPPFITSLQIIYKYAGFPFGQLWLSTIFISFLVFLYQSLASTVHKLAAGLLLVALLAIPEMYAYTFMALFDYSNAVFFFLSSWFLFEYFKNGNRSYILLAGLLIGFATYIRSETLILAGFMAILVVWHHFRKWTGLRAPVFSLASFLVPPAFFYALSIPVYINRYLPADYGIESKLNKDAFNVEALAERFVTVNTDVIFSETGILYYGYFIFFFIAVLLSDLVFFRKLSRGSLNWLFAILVIYLGLILLGHLLPLMDIDHTTKRGFLKMFPLMILFMANSTTFRVLSEKVTRWEEKQ